MISANGFYLEMFIGIHENKRKLFVEGKNTKKEIQFKEIFDVTFEEDRWYSILMTYSSKNGVRRIGIYFFNLYKGKQKEFRWRDLSD